jgi:rRNA-processing protein FCF1
MKVRWCFDTSALVSLGHTDMLQKIVEYVDIVISEDVIQELKDISAIPDPDGASAERCLIASDSFTFLNTTHTHHAEDGLHSICLEEKIPLITDDLAAVKRFNKDTICLFSVHVLYHLYIEGQISKEDAILSNEKMRKERSWKENLISIMARTLYE